MSEFPLRPAKALACAVTLLLCACHGSSGAGIFSSAGPSAGLVDVGNGRRMYVECRGQGLPVVILIGGHRASAGDWAISHTSEPSVGSAVAETTRVCAYDRPGTPVGQQPSRSDAAPQPTTAAEAVRDLHRLQAAADGATSYVLVGHSYGGLIAKLYARNHPQHVAGLVLVDALSEGLQDAETPEQWAIQRLLAMCDITQIPAEYPALERVEIDQSFAQVRAAPALQPTPLAVLSADRPWGPLIPALIASGQLPATTPPDFGYVTDAAQAQAQAALAALVPGSVHIKDTHSGHDIHKDQARLVTHAIRSVVAAARANRSTLRQEASPP